jgi:hypothetical protein
VRRELKLGKAKANIRLCEQIYRMATGDPTLETTVIAAIFWAKCQMGWRESRRAETDTGALGDGAAGGQVLIVSDPDGA